MAKEVFMPKAGMDMQEGTIISWFANEGDSVRKGEALLEIETDKVSMEVESPADGILLKRYFDDGAVCAGRRSALWPDRVHRRPDHHVSGRTARSVLH